MKKIKRDDWISLFLHFIVSEISIIELTSILILEFQFTNFFWTLLRFSSFRVPGRILNRFSKDMGIMDELLPKVMLEALQVCCVVSGIMIMETILNPWMLIPIAILIVVFSFVTKFYLATAQNIKRLEGVSKYWNE